MDNIEQKILDAGYINNNRLHRRYVMTQMLRHLDNFDDYFITRKPYEYIWNSALNEFSMQCECDNEERKLRFLLFGGSVISEMLKDFKVQIIKSYITPATLDYLDTLISSAKTARNSWQVKQIIEHFIRSYDIKQNYTKPDIWITSFKAIGAYYTMDSLIKLYDCRTIRQGDVFVTLSTEDALSCLDKWKSTPELLFDIMLDFIKANQKQIDELTQKEKLQEP
jgi:hypothetical protein